MQNAITDLKRDIRGLCASFDPSAGPERAAAFKADIERLATGTVTLLPPRKPAPDRNEDIDVFQFSARVEHCLRRWGIHYVGNLLDRSGDELMDLRNFGSGSLYEVRDVLAAHGLELRS
jgi:DNA-directed RNA polymerase alpha subunit